MLSSLVGYRTIIAAVVYILLSTYTGITGFQITGFQPDPNWLRNDVLALMGLFAKLGVSGAMRGILEMGLNAILPSIVAKIREAMALPPGK